MLTEEAFLLYAEIKVPVPGPKAFWFVNGDKVDFGKKGSFSTDRFKIRVFSRNTMSKER